MVLSEIYCLKWAGYGENASVCFQELRKAIDFTDVTLVTNDKQYVKAHRIVLAATSPFFWELLKHSKEPNQLVYMKGIESKYLLAVVDFIYHGEVNIAQEDLANFLEIAEDLELKGLRGMQGGEIIKIPELQIEEQGALNKKERPPLGTTKETEYHPNDDVLPKSNEPTKKNSFAEQDTNIESKSVLEGDTTEANVKALQILEEELNAKLDEQILSMMQRAKGTKRSWECKVCGKINKEKATIKIHIDSTHLEGTPQLNHCPDCGEVKVTSSAMWSHRELHRKDDLHVSSGQVVKCEKCDRVFLTPSELKIHSPEHIGEKPFKCAYCEVQLYSRGYLKRHINIVHGEKHRNHFKCDHCDYSSKHQIHLDKHILAKHTIDYSTNILYL